MIRNKLFYEFLKERTWKITERWYDTLNKDLVGIYRTTNPEEIELLKYQNHLFQENFINLFNDPKEEFQKNFDDFVATIAIDEGHQNTPLTEILGEFFRQQYFYFELLEEFISLHPEELNIKQIFAYHYAISSTINDIVLRFSAEFIRQSQKRLVAQQEMIHELSAPIIKLMNSTAVLPLVGEIDTNRAKVMLEHALKQCAKDQVQHLYIDLTGVPIVDTMVAKQLFQMIDALKLIGVSSSLSGLRPSIAQTSVQLGIDFTNIETHSTIEQAMRKHK